VTLAGHDGVSCVVAGGGLSRLVVWMLLAGGCAGPGSVGALAPDCAGCHAEVAADHRESRHARAGEGELFAALRDHLGESACDTCHLPEGGEGDGLGCTTCHAAVGNEATADGRLVHTFRGLVQGAATSSNRAHAVQAGFPGDSALCGTCHESTALPAFHETPYSHWAVSPAAAAGVRCQDCHQRREPGVADPAGAVRHTWTGLAGDPTEAVALLRRAVRLTVEREGDGAVVALVNLGEGHDLPDGASFLRELAVLVDGALPAADARLSAQWTARGAVVDDPAAADGNAGHALAPGEVRTWRVQGADPVRACVVFTQERPALRRLLGLPVDAAREAVREVVCADG
jgi:hypothetical protein